MADASHLDTAYFIDNTTFNCPFCKRRNVIYSVPEQARFDWTDSKPCICFTVQCSSCEHVSMHLTYDTELIGTANYPWRNVVAKSSGIDELVFYSVPTSFFSLDARMPRKIRELMTEADGCAKMNFLTGASSCMRKAIYQLLVEQGISDGRYDDRITALKSLYPDIDAILFDTLGQIKDMANNQVHEGSWEKWDSAMTRLVFQTLKVVLDEVYVVPNERSLRARAIQELHNKVFGPSKT